MRTRLLALVASLSLAACTSGTAGSKGDPGAAGQPGAAGSPGPQGTQGPSGTLSFGYFYALMPGDNAATVGAATAVAFPQDGAASGIGRSNASATDFVLPQAGVYEVSWQVSVDEPGQLVLGLDTGAGIVEQAHTVAGRATGTTQITNHVLVTTGAAGAILTVRNPTGNSPALTVTPNAGGTHAVSASLLIKQLQ